MIGAQSATRTLHRLIRAVLLLNFIFLVMDISAFGEAAPDFLRRSHLDALPFYWILASTLLVICLLLAQPILRACQRAKIPGDSLTLIDKGFLVDLILVIFWIIALFLGAARYGAGASG